MTFILVYVTNPNKKEAEKIAQHLLNKRLVACANIFPINSMYWWKNKIEKSKEYVLILKTDKKKWEKIKGEIKRIHSYTVPCIIKINVDANKEYKNWLESVTK